MVAPPSAGSEIVGPSSVKRKLEARGASLTGRLSPLSLVTVPPESREVSGIPQRAHSFAYCFPPPTPRC